jgi:DtxR family Mn-dependent transcriptional regulator
MEDYMETIAALVASEGSARVRDIAQQLQVSKPGVTQALHVLSEKGLVSYRPYGTLTLTKRGREIAAQVQHRHDTIKLFLQKVLLIEESVADANACRLEHVIDKKVLNRLAHYLDFVQRCPHSGADWLREGEYYCSGARAPDDGNPSQLCEKCAKEARTGDDLST